MKTAATTYESYSGISIVFLFMMRPCRKSYRTAFMDGKPLWQYEPSSKKMVYVRMERQTGIYDAATQRAVQVFQNLTGHKPTGMVDRATWNLLAAAIESETN